MPSSYRSGKWSPNSEEPQDLGEGGIESYHHKPGHNPWDTKSIKYIKFVRVNDEWIKWLLDFLVPTSNTRSRMRQCDTRMTFGPSHRCGPQGFSVVPDNCTLCLFSYYLLQYWTGSIFLTFSPIKMDKRNCCFNFLFSLLLWSNFSHIFWEMAFLLWIWNALLHCVLSFNAAVKKYYSFWCLSCVWNVSFFLWNLVLSFLCSQHSEISFHDYVFWMGSTLSNWFRPSHLKTCIIQW